MTCLSQFNKKDNFQFDEFDLTSFTRKLVTYQEVGNFVF